MSFKSNYVDNIRFPEHPKLIRAVGNEQYFGLQLILKGYESIYVPSNPILHIMRESLSRTSRDKLLPEYQIMRSLIKRAIEDHYISNSNSLYK
jgi:hypothetical protein